MKRSYQDDITHWNAPRIIGEIFGWEHLTKDDWQRLSECPPEGYEPGKPYQPPRPSVYGELEPLWKQCDPATSDYSALQPSDTVNHNLSGLVEIICTRFTPSAAVAKEQADQHHHDVVDEVLQRLKDEPSLQEKMLILRDTASFAEGEMELFYCNEILKKTADPVYVAQHQLKEDASVQERMDALKDVLSPFPYPDNYEKIVQAEVALMKQPLDPQFFRLDDVEALSQQERDALEGRIETLKRSAERLVDALGDAHSLKRNITSLEGRSVTFPGSGSLPLTGIMLHICTGAKINLIDIDPDAIAASRQLIGRLGDMGIVDTSAFQIIEGDVVNMRYQKAADTPAQDTLRSADSIRQLMAENTRADFITRRHARRRTTQDSSMQAEFDGSLLRDDFQYEVVYSYPDKETPYAFSFTGYQTTDEGEQTRTQVHQVYFDKDRGWRRSQDRQLVSSDIVFLASLIPDDLRRETVDTMLRQTHVPDAIMMRSVKGLAHLAYGPTDTNHMSDVRAPFYGEAVPETHLLETPVNGRGTNKGVATLMHPSLIPADGEVLNSTEIHYLPFSNLLRGHNGHDKPVAERIDTMIEDIEHDIRRLCSSRGRGHGHVAALNAREQERAGASAAAR
jgi:hypothetical protein